MICILLNVILPDPYHLCIMVIFILFSPGLTGAHEYLIRIVDWPHNVLLIRYHIILSESKFYNYITTKLIHLSMGLLLRWVRNPSARLLHCTVTITRLTDWIPCYWNLTSEGPASSWPIIFPNLHINYLQYFSFVQYYLDS